jgi:hypothetical protein
VKGAKVAKVAKAPAKAKGVVKKKK